MFKESPSLGTTALSTKCVSTKSAKMLQSCHVGSLKYKMKKKKKSALAGRFLTTSITWEGLSTKYFMDLFFF